MEHLRSRFQGVNNIIRFNWHYYIVIAGLITNLIVAGTYSNTNWQVVFLTLAFLAVITVIFSLTVSFYIYDASEFYSFNWLPDLKSKSIIFNVHAGFDETSTILVKKFRPHIFKVFDFYNPAMHTELSIKRARKAYQPFPGTEALDIVRFRVPSEKADYILLIMSAHEIREINQRVCFFRNIKSCLNNEGKIIVVEHLRDFNNFIAFNIGFFHFYTRVTWLTTFANADLHIENEIRVNPFVRTFILH